MSCKNRIIAIPKEDLVGNRRFGTESSVKYNLSRPESTINVIVGMVSFPKAGLAGPRPAKPSLGMMAQGRSLMFYTQTISLNFNTSSLTKLFMCRKVFNVMD